MGNHGHFMNKHYCYQVWSRRGVIRNPHYLHILMSNEIINKWRYVNIYVTLCGVLKILWLAHRDPLNPSAGGAERTIYEVCTRLVKKDYDITLITAEWRGCNIRDTIGGIKVIRLGNSILMHILVPLFLILSSLTRKGFDLVVNDLGHAVPWPSAFIFKKNNIIFFRHLHARSLPGQVNRLLAVIITAIEKTYQIIYHNGIFVTESSTSVADLVHLGIDKTRIVRIPPGVDTHLFHPNKKTDFPSIVYFGGMRRYKRPEECIYLL
ncbi:MAG: glycosyltransferase, partial [Candidatus Micrarchaeaceae archaeon]